MLCRGTALNPGRLSPPSLLVLRAEIEAAWVEFVAVDTRHDRRGANVGAEPRLRRDLRAALVVVHNLEKGEERGES